MIIWEGPTSRAHCEDRYAEEMWALEASGKRCFYCGGRIGFPCVQWNGWGVVYLYIHPECVSPLAMRLFRDAHEVECRLSVAAHQSKEAAKSSGQRKR